MPKIIHRTLLLLILIAMFPPLLVARSRAVRSNVPRVHMIQDMDNQARLEAQHRFDLFADERGMRPHPEGTVSRTSTGLDEHFYRGLDEGVWATTFPESVPLNRQTLLRGEERFNIYCAPCHGQSGNGNGMVNQRAMQLMAQGQATWVTPTAVFAPTVSEQPVGQIFNTITHGVRTMPAYGAQIPEADRWAIVAWVLALQRSQDAQWDDLPADVREQLEKQRRDAIEAAAEAERRAAEEAAEQQQQQQDQQNAEGTGGGDGAATGETTGGEGNN